jgi:hypothetical protein
MRHNKLAIIILLVAILLSPACQTNRRYKLNELLQTDRNFRAIPDSGVVKAIVADSIAVLIDSARSITSVSDTVELTGAEYDYAVQKLYHYQDSVSASIHQANEVLKSAGEPMKLELTTASFTPSSLLGGELSLSVEERQAILADVQKFKFTKLPPYRIFDGKPLNPDDPIVDFRRFGITPPVAFQGNGTQTCWAFSTCAAYECSYAMLFGKTIRVSEQYVINCSGANRGLYGGQAAEVFKWLCADPGQTMAVDTELVYNGKPNSDQCEKDLKTATDYFAAGYALVGRNKENVPSTHDIKEALCQHGPLISDVWMTDNWRSYGPTSGAFIDRNRYQDINHSVLIVGWDDHIGASGCWLIQNSWGTGWGSKCSETGYNAPTGGYMWLPYNICNIGWNAAWVEARK